MHALHEYLFHLKLFRGDLHSKKEFAASFLLKTYFFKTLKNYKKERPHFQEFYLFKSKASQLMMPAFVFCLIINSDYYSSSLGIKLLNWIMHIAEHYFSRNIILSQSPFQKQGL